jgi:hypothetical protein
VICVAAPLPTCSEKLPAESAALLLATDVVEYHEAVAASLLTFTTWVPGEAVPVAEAVTRFESEELTSTDDSTPVTLFSASRSFSTVVVSPLMFVRAASWFVIVVCCASHCVSGTSAAVTAAFTAAVTSIASELDPVVASNSELRSIPFEVVGDDDEADPSNEAKSEVDRPTELIPHLAKPDYSKNTMAG